MDKISVIVPVWNAHDYLERCVDSIWGQTCNVPAVSEGYYKNCEISA